MTAVAPIQDIQLVLAVFQRMAEQYELPTEACDQVGLSYVTFARLTATYPQLRDMREEAEDRLYDAMAEALPRIDIHPVYGRTDPKMANVVSGNIKWLLERRRQKSYGAKSTIEHQITADREVIDALNQAKARAHGKAADQAVNQPLTLDIDDLVLVDGVASVAQKAVASVRTTPFGTFVSRLAPEPHETPEQRFKRELAEIS